MRPIILDMDPGVDDALALLLALRCHETQVRAVTTVSGNVGVERGSDNALRVLELAGSAEVPVYRGEGLPLEGPAITAEHIHGPGGLGAAQLPDSPAGIAGDAVGFLTEQLVADPGALTIVATGPLTNLATLERRCPGTLRLAGRIVVMGGAIHGPGNAAPLSEFNFLADPMAAREVLRSGASILLVPLDATHQVLVSPQDLAEIASGADVALERFVLTAASTPMEIAKREYGYEGLYLHDPVAVALTVRPELGRTRRSHLDVETDGELTRGQVLADERSFTDSSQRRGVSTEWVYDVDRSGFMDLFAERLFGVGTVAAGNAR